MITSNSTISIILIFLCILIYNPNGAKAQTNSNKESYVQSENTREEFRVGSEIGRDLAFGCSMLIATVNTIGEPKKDELNQKTYTQIDLSINQQLWGEQTNKENTITIYKLHNPSSPIDRGPWSIWDNVQLKCGEQLLIVLWTDNMKKQRQYAGKSAELATVISNQSFFEPIQEALQHIHYIQNPSYIENTRKLLISTPKPVLTGCLVSYLDNELFPTDSQISLLIDLLDNRQVSQNVWISAIRTLTKVLLRDYVPLPQATHNAITQALLNASISINLNLAKPAITALTILTQNNLDIDPFLTTDTRNKLSKNYYQIFGNDPSLNEEHKYLKSKLNPTIP